MSKAKSKKRKPSQVGSNTATAPAKAANASRAKAAATGAAPQADAAKTQPASQANDHRAPEGKAGKPAGNATRQAAPQNAPTASVQGNPTSRDNTTSAVASEAKSATANTAASTASGIKPTQQQSAITPPPESKQTSVTGSKPNTTAETAGDLKAGKARRPTNKPTLQPTGKPLARYDLRGKLPHFVALMRLDKPIGIALLLWPTLIALWMAGKGTPAWQNVVIFTLGVVVMRSAGCVINDFADRKVDGLVSRTQNRPLATGALTSKEALTLFAVLMLVALGLALLLGREVLMWSVGGALLATIYPFMKRYTHWPQAVLGAAFAWAIPMAFVAEGETPGRLCWLLYLSTVSWTIAYDTEYAMVDRADDLKAGIKSTAILFGDMDRMMIGSLQFLAVLGFWLAGQSLHAGGWYLLGLTIMVALFAWQQWLIRNAEAPACFRAFLNNHLAGLALFAGTVLHFLTTPATT